MTEPDPGRGEWLRRQRELRGWAVTEMARQLIQAGHGNGDEAIPGVRDMRRNVERWESGRSISDRYRLHYCRALGIDPGEFGKHSAAPAPPDVVDPLLPEMAAMIYRERQEPGLGEFAAGHEVVMAAANESGGHAAEREPYGIGDATSEQLRADVTRLSRQMDAGSPLLTFLDLRRVRDRIHLLLDRRLRLREQGDLYFLLGCVNGMMGATADQLGYLDAAEELLRAGWAYASIIEHDSLRGMLRLKLAVAMNHRGRYTESRDLAADGLRYVSQGSLGAELHVAHAGAAARLGDLETARQSVALGDDAWDSDYTDELVEIGGEFAVTRATHYSLAGRALVDGGGTEPDAAVTLEQAISLYDAGPGEGEEFWFAGKPLAGANLALVRLRSGALDAAVAALEPAMTLPVEQRISDITNRLADVRRELAAPVFRGSAQARDLGDAIENFGREAVTVGLRSLTG